ncbi:hypothetical protein L596_019933 [Steinernema carpocapsae]|uniref:Chromatin target of PRMT1 protein C-terminal domain-containing protein n=1 Tax=Steinernema carpocapsae TaxID=34508 RepID=A0A4U5MS23_STECR|nr:hypothetical protein L596_019933 [Steinernema carpocapsae]
MSIHSSAKNPLGAGHKFIKNAPKRPAGCASFAKGSKSFSAVRVSNLRISNSALLQRISVAPGPKTSGAISKKPQNCGSKKAAKPKKAKKPKFAQKPKKSTEELDRELDEYMSHGKVVKISELLSSLGLN